MNLTVKRLALSLGTLALTTSCAATSNPSIQAQQQPPLQLIKVDGFSTVFPITQAIAKEFQKTQVDKAQVKVAVSGTTGGYSVASKCCNYFS